ncbi:MAG: aminoglycoside phosphotransferase family protein [Flavihumibacter sp.]
MEATAQQDLVKTILADFPVPLEQLTFRPFGSGLINSTYLVNCGGRQYILQKINQAVFRHPEYIAENVKLINDYLHDKHPEYLFISPLLTRNRQNMFWSEAMGFYRLTPFVPDSQSIDVVENAAEAFESASQFARFTAKLAGFDSQQLKITLPDFHNLQLRYDQFRATLATGNTARIEEAREAIRYIESQVSIVSGYEAICSRSDLYPLRVMHHDTKISNVLLDKNRKGICVIDLDTVMPGYFFSDVGDMLRTYLSPVSEEEKDYSKISIRVPIFEAIVKGYFQEMHNELTTAEKEHFIFAGKIMIYMQAIRFLTDYINNDVYYGAKYPNHNFVRAGNQLQLLRKLNESEPALQQILTQQINAHK